MIADALLRRQSDSRPVKVAVVGAGRFGTSVIAQISQIPGIEVTAIADVSASNLEEAWKAHGAPPESIVWAESSGAAADAVIAGRRAAVADASLVPGLPVDVVVEATGVPEVSARVCRDSLAQATHVVNVTVECDVAVGAALSRLAGQNNAVYSLADGDQPAAVKRLIDWSRALGFQVIAAGRGTRRYRSDRAGVPEEAFARYGYDQDTVDRRRLNPRMYNSFRDGTKSQIEMTALANMTGLVPDVPGMHEPTAGVGDLPNLFRLIRHGGILTREGVVELANCVLPDDESDIPEEISIGVFAVIRSDHPLTADDMRFYGLRMAPDGRTGVIYTPYHLCGVETPLTIAEAALFGHAVAAPREAPVADVAAVAKRDLDSGERLDGSGGSTLSGYIVEWHQARRMGLLPLALADGVTLRRSTAKGSPLRYCDVDLPGDAIIQQLRRELGDAGSDSKPALPADQISFPD
ncbi:MAG: flagellar biosynthesis protein FlgA [Chloroflexi bacterium]|nr:flagellar biosynthesis protein FlgA [Chloroflexota bacterium]MCY3937874.1 flagellar biosynthesis protein FlgA [Chloroflexota bacterium]